MDLSQLFLTSSYDFSVKLWSGKEPRPLATFENHAHFVKNVAWSPAHPALFACCDADGGLEVWDLNSDTELPAAVASAEVRGDPACALNRLLWSPNGQHIVTGSAGGAIALFDLHESLAVPRPDAWTRMSRTLMDLKQAQVPLLSLSFLATKYDLHGREGKSKRRVAGLPHSKGHNNVHANASEAWLS